MSAKRSKTAKATARLDAIFTEIGLAPPPDAAFIPLTREDAYLAAGQDPHRPGPRPVDRETCPTGKVRYTSERLAKDAIRAILRHGRGDTGHLIAYHCDQCHGWHQTSRPAIPKTRRWRR